MIISPFKLLYTQATLPIEFQKIRDDIEIPII